MGDSSPLPLPRRKLFIETGSLAGIRPSLVAGQVRRRGWVDKPRRNARGGRVGRALPSLAARKSSDSQGQNDAESRALKAHGEASLRAGAERPGVLHRPERCSKRVEVLLDLAGLSVGDLTSHWLFLVPQPNEVDTQ